VGSRPDPLHPDPNIHLLVELFKRLVQSETAADML
jgi:hypothetical protein